MPPLCSGNGISKALFVQGPGATFLDTCSFDPIEYRCIRAMAVHIIIRNTGEKTETLEELTERFLADDVSFIAEDEKSPGELLTESVYEDFVKAR
jgi:hypothetical protein